MIRRRQDRAGRDYRGRIARYVIHQKTHLEHPRGEAERAAAQTLHGLVQEVLARGKEENGTRRCMLVESVDE